MNGFEENEISKNANGGTEILKRRLASLLPADLLDHFQIIASRPRELQADKIRIMFFNDLPNDPEVANFKDEEYRKQFHKLVFVSHWQYEMYRNILGVPYSDHSMVIEVGIDPIELVDKPTDVIRCVYTSTPHRGLNILVPVFAKLAEQHKDIHLDVFSSFKLYGWDDPKDFDQLFDAIKTNDQMTYHGTVPHADLKEYLKKCHVFAYPCIWPETACQALMEAMSAGLVCVHSDYAALPLTAGGQTVMYNGDQDLQKHAGIFSSALSQAIEMVRNRDETFKSRMTLQKIYADNRFHITKAKFQWEFLLRDLLAKHPDADNRKAPEKTFRYIINQG